MATVAALRNLPDEVPPLLRPTNRRMRRRPGRVQLAVEASCISLDLAPEPDLSASAASGQEVLVVAAQGGYTELRMPGQAPDETPGDNVATAVAAAGPAVGSVVPGLISGPGLRRLETHVWHARRMAMESRWGHLLASHAAGRGRGSRSLLAQLRCRRRHGGLGGGRLGAGVSGGVLLHDSSYLGCVELRGHQRVLAAVLRRMSDPCHLDSLLDRPELISGAAEWALFLHRPGAFPHGPLAPVRALWLQDRPVTTTTTTATVAEEQGCSGGGKKAEEVSGRHLDSDGIDPEGWARRCVLWLWVHAAAFTDVWEALHQATAELEQVELAAEAAEAGGEDGQEDMAAPSGGGGVSIRSRCSDLRRIDVVGEAATAALARVLLPTHTHVAAAGGASSGGAMPTTMPTVAAAVAGSRSAASAYGACRGTSTSHYPSGEIGDSMLGGRVWWSFKGDCQGLDPEGPSGAPDGSGWRRHWRWPAGAVLGMTAADPRLAAPVRVGGIAMYADALAEAAGRGIYSSTDGNGGGDGGLWWLPEEELKGQMLQWPEAGDWTAGAAALWRTVPAPRQPQLQPEPSPATAVNQSADAPSPPLRPPRGPAATAAVLPPLGPNQVSAVRRTARKRLLHAGFGIRLADAPPHPPQPSRFNPCASTSSPGGVEVAGGAGISFPLLVIRRPEGRSWGTSSRASTVVRQSRSARARTAAGPGGSDLTVRVCDTAPATSLLESPGSGWSLVLPAHWVMPVWMALAFTGARPTGQSEWRQLAAHFRTPCFPYDHPYTPAGVRLNRGLAAEMAATASQRPLGRARRPTDFGPLANWSRLRQPPLLPVQPVPSALRGGAGGAGRSGGGRSEGVLQGEEGPRVGRSRQVTAVAGAAGAVEAVTVGGGDGGEVAADMDVDGDGDMQGRDGGAATWRISADGNGGCGGTEAGGGFTQWALALNKRTLQCCLLGSGKGGGQQPVAAAAAASSGLKDPETAFRHVEELDLKPPPPQQQRPVRGRQPASKDCLHGWTLRKALRLGLVKQPTQPPPPLLPPPMHQQPALAPPAAAPTPTMQWQRHPHQPQYGTVVYVALRVEGRGRCEAGAEVLGLQTTGYGTPGQGRAAGGRLVRTDMDMDSEVDMVEGSAGAAEQYVLAAAGSGSRAVAEQKVRRAMVVLGYVVSASPRGSPTYPGGLALCDAVGLASQGEGDVFRVKACSGAGGGDGTGFRGGPETRLCAWVVIRFQRGTLSLCCWYLRPAVKKSLPGVSLTQFRGPDAPHPQSGCSGKLRYIDVSVAVLYTRS
ncbi:hypothetical protein VOLCADRAFT_93949 [Volvox carteri f. nagariensis]|uniref:POPLD domain-containing protein n=1 Tax=Volvox carteri f. nagariensis TaxID=3068 RepID=D8U3I0_VOLCA|nr:uncharacterized protein VOLCADRAFT_93949 [Volvox carteri f. nagariensis]EFJ45760.1 hypothetical protein VOLCADRAFT_93949 [Volvox carteri f. nagariensis]|eukprot:XP_002953161.1 hypothetical protein VOLCADRAFT_93949 [Volvox carteri f. nagariensis]